MKKKLIGYNVVSMSGEVVEKLVGTQPRKKLDKLRKTNNIRKVYANRRGELVS